MKLAYCDYIAKIIKKSVDGASAPGLLTEGVMKAETPQLDLHPEHGYFVSTKKTIQVEDHNGKKYLVTIEEK